MIVIAFSCIYNHILNPKLIMIHTLALFINFIYSFHFYLIIHNYIYINLFTNRLILTISIYILIFL